MVFQDKDGLYRCTGCSCNSYIKPREEVIERHRGCYDPVAQGHTRDDPDNLKKRKGANFPQCGGEFPWDYELPTLPDDETDLPYDNKNKKCKHEWKSHHGLIEIFEYCKHCDVRKDDTNN